MGDARVVLLLAGSLTTASFCVGYLIGTGLRKRMLLVLEEANAIIHRLLDQNERLLSAQEKRAWDGKK
jgi:hypothetical protein